MVTVKKNLKFSSFYHFFIILKLCDLQKYAIFLM